jgi:hypothetical protein
MWFAAVMVALLLYALSPVAVGVLIDRGVVAGDPEWLIIYYPLFYLSEEVPAVRQFYEWLFRVTEAVF